MKKLHGFQYGNYMIVYLVIAIVIDLVPFLCCSNVSLNGNEYAGMFYNGMSNAIQLLISFSIEFSSSMLLSSASVPFITLYRLPSNSF